MNESFHMHAWKYYSIYTYSPFKGGLQNHQQTTPTGGCYWYHFSWTFQSRTPGWCTSPQKLMTKLRLQGYWEGLKRDRWQLGYWTFLLPVLSSRDIYILSMHVHHGFQVGMFFLYLKTSKKLPVESPGMCNYLLVLRDVWLFLLLPMCFVYFADILLQLVRRMLPSFAHKIIFIAWLIAFFKQI